MRKDRIFQETLGDENLLTPSDLYNTEFKSSLMGGYDKDEVDTYLERVADAMEALINRVRELKEEMEKQRQELEEIRGMESTLRAALVSSQRFGESIEEAARRQADALIEQARAESKRLPDELRREIDDLRTERNRLRTDLRAVLAAHSALLLEIPTAEGVQESLQQQAETFEAQYEERPPAFSGER
ncbi:MAG: DivIVA domain-containing protein [Candidatus Hydrogenedens sp.]|nr:DivIVA domain-containing protein [Candidatus Hydrogenedens sp.]